MIKISCDNRPYILLRKELRNRNFTILSNNCMAAILYHNLGLRFDSPTINLYFQGNDFVKFANDLPYYIKKANLVETSDESVTWPVGILGEGEQAIKIFFKHYPTFKNAKYKWEERKQRINYNNIYIVMGDDYGVTVDTIRQFEGLPYQHKVMMTGKPFPQFPHTFCVPHSNLNGHLADAWAQFHENYLLGHRYFEKFNYVKFFNNEYKFNASD